VRIQSRVDTNAAGPASIIQWCHRREGKKAIAQPNFLAVGKSFFCQKISVYKCQMETNNAYFEEIKRQKLKF